MFIYKNKSNLTKEGLNANPKRDGITDLNITQIILLETLNVYRTGKMKSFISDMEGNDPRYLDMAQKRDEIQDYLSILKKQTTGEPTYEMLYDLVKKELKGMGYVDGKGSLTSKGLSELTKIRNRYRDGYSLI